MLLQTLLFSPNTALASGNELENQIGGSYFINNNEATSSTTTGTPLDPTPATTPVPANNTSFIPLDIRLPEGFFTSFSELINDVLRFVIIIAALLTFLYLIWAAFDWITSGGDQGRLSQARGKITSALIGLIVVAASYAILLVVLNFLGYASLEDVFSELGNR